MPGRLVFRTTSDGASTDSERMRITSSGNVGIGDDSPMTSLSVVENQLAAAEGGGDTNIIWCRIFDGRKALLAFWIKRNLDAN